MSRFSLAAVALAAIGILASSAHGALITDPVGDFLATYTGPQGGDLDVVSAQVFYNGTTFTFTSTQNGAVGTTAGGLYVWGIDRGANLAPFGAFAPGVLFDAVVVLVPGGQSFVDDILSSVITPIAAATVSGNSISDVVAASLLPSSGFTAQNYLVDLWPRNGLASGAAGLVQIADFAPNANDAAVTVTPEPATGLLFGSAIALLALVRRTRKA
jgi:hypothetical protein